MSWTDKKNSGKKIGKIVASPENCEDFYQVY